MRLPPDWLDRLQPPPGHVYLLRDEQPTMYRGLVIIPDRVRQGKKSQVAQVVRVGDDVDPGLFGAKVLVSAGVGRRICFGDHEEHVRYVCRPEELLAVFYEGEQPALLGVQEQRVATGRHRETPATFDGKAEEGAKLRPQR